MKVVRFGSARMILSVFLFLGGTVIPTAAAGQYFGKNPMRTNPELASLRRLSAGRVDIIYYTPIDTLARLALPIADSCITEMAATYEHGLAPHERVTILLYSEWEDYRQGWIFPGYLTPPSSGYTERLKGNIGVSFDADAGRLHQVVCHEVAHKYQYSIHARSYDRHPMHDIVPKRREYYLPPWVTEGDATFVSHGGGSLGEMYVRYIVNSGKVDYGLEKMLQAPRSLVSYFLGAEFWRFVSGETDQATLSELRWRERGIFARLRMGDSLRVRFLKDQSLYRNPGEALEAIYAVPIPDLDRAFRLYLNLRFGRDYTETLGAEMFGDRLIGEPDEWYDRPYVAPARVISGADPGTGARARADTVVDLYYTAANDGYESIYVRTLPYREKPPWQPDPALYDACLWLRPGDCVEYGEPPPPPPEEQNEQEEEQRPDEDGAAAPEPTAEEKTRAKRRAEVHEASRKVIRGGTESCQSLDIRSNRIDVHQDRKHRLLAFACTDSKRQTKVIAVFDLDLDREIERYALPGIGTVRSPSWSPDGRRIVFSGIARSGTSDLYLLDRADESVSKLTDDVYADGDLDWSPDGQQIVFSSDRGPYGEPGRGRTHANLYLLDVRTRETLYLTYGDWIDLAPTWSPDGSRVLFSSDRDGAFDLYVVDLSGSGRRLTRVSTGILSAQWWPDGQSIVFTAFDGGQQIYRMDVPPAQDPDEAPAGDLIALGETFHGGSFDRTWRPEWSWDRHLAHPLVRMAEPSTVPERYHLTLGDVGGEWSTGFGQAGVSLFFSNRDNSRLLYTQFYTGFFSGTPSGGLVEVADFQNLHAEIGYLNLARRFFWGGRCYRHSGLYTDEVYRNIYGEDRLGCGFLGQYPLSVFRRIELTAGLEWSKQADVPDLLLVDFERFRAQPETIEFAREAFLLRTAVAYVKDNSLWVGNFYPVDGWRYRIACGIDLDLGHFRPDTYTCLGDIRKYFRVGRRSNFGTRLYLFRSGGYTPRRFTLDWRNHMTLYPQYSLYGQTGWIANLYLGFPLIDRMSFGLPVARIGFPPVRGSIFADFGQGWVEGQPPGPVWGDAGVKATSKMWILWLSLSWGRMFLINGGDLELPDRYTGTRWMLTIRGNP